MPRPQGANRVSGERVGWGGSHTRYDYPRGYRTLPPQSERL